MKVTSAVEAALAAYSCSVSCIIRVGNRETTSPMDRKIVLSDFSMTMVFRALSEDEDDEDEGEEESTETIFNWRNIL